MLRSQRTLQPSGVRGVNPAVGTEVSVWSPATGMRDESGSSPMTLSTRGALTAGPRGLQLSFTGSQFTPAATWLRRPNTTYECWLVVLGGSFSTAGSDSFLGLTGNALSMSGSNIRITASSSARLTSTNAAVAGDAFFAVMRSGDYRLYHRGTLQTDTGSFGSPILEEALNQTNDSVSLLARWTNETPDDSLIWRMLADPSIVFAERNVWIPVESAASGYTLTADAASFTLTGVATGLIAARSLTADQQSYSLTGVAANLLRGFSLTADQSTFALSGVDAGLTTARLLTADQQTYALTGVDAGLTYTPAGAYTLTADVGTFTLTGNAAGLNYYKLTADTVAFAFTGNDATLTYTPLGAYTLTADSGSFALTGNVAGLAYSGEPQQTTQTPAGRPRRRMVYVEIDGKPVVVGSEEEAVQLLEKLEEKAQEVARVAVERASKANKRPTRKVLADARKTLEVPRISTPGRQDLGARYRERIREIYEQAAQAIEIAARMRDLEMAIEADDEEVLLLL